MMNISNKLYGQTAKKRIAQHTRSPFPVQSQTHEVYLQQLLTTCRIFEKDMARVARRPLERQLNKRGKRRC
jgi:hypothetical protein